MKNLSKKSVIIIISLVITGLFGLKFHIEIQDLFYTVSDKIIQTGQTTSQKNGGISRQISYLGRLKEAEQLIEHEYYDLALLEIIEAIKQKPALISPYLLLGELHIRQENLAQLQALIDSLNSNFPDRFEPLTLEIRKHIIQKEFAQVMTIFTQNQPEIAEKSPHLEFYYALLLALQNDHATAKEILTKLEHLPSVSNQLAVTKDGVSETPRKETDTPAVDTKFSQKITDISIVYEEFEEFSDGQMPHLLALISKKLAENNEAHLAREFAETAIKEDIEYVDAWVLRGYAELMLQHYDEALLDLKRAYELDPIRPETHYFLALALEKMGQDTEASLFFEKALENEFQFTNEVKWKLISIFTKQGKHDRVVELYREVIADNPNPKEFVVVMHNSIDILKRPELALEISAELFDQNPDDVLAMNLYAWALIANEKYPEADNLLDDTLDLDEKNPRTFLNLGLLAEKQAKFSEAIEHYKQSYEIGKEQPFNSVTNLAAERYNQLIEMEKPSEIEAPSREANSP